MDAIAAQTGNFTARIELARVAVTDVQRLIDTPITRLPVACPQPFDIAPRRDAEEAFVLAVKV